MDFDALQLRPVTAVIGLAAVGLLWLLRKPKKNLPPGPRSLPIVGTMLSFNMADFTDTEKSSKILDKYGDIITMSLMGQQLIILNSYDVIKEALITKSVQFADRGVAKTFTSQRLNPNSSGGIVVRDFDDVGRALRSKCLTILRDLGAGRAALSDAIAREANDLASAFESHDGRAFEPSETLTAAVANVILSVSLSQRRDYADPELQELIANVNKFTSSLRIMMLLDLAPFMRVVPQFGRLLQDLLDANSGVLSFAERQLSSIRANLAEGERSNFAESFLDFAHERTYPAMPDNEVVLKSILRDFLVAGVETTASSLQWTLIALANNLDVQERLHAAVRDVIGDERAYSPNDSVPYLDAFVWEVQRHFTVTPMGVPRAVSTPGDAELAGYTIPKDATILCNLFAVHHNQKTWGDPEVFRPERFLNDNGQFVKHTHVIPFGIGKRSCLGELLARQELYIFTAMISQRFKILPEEGTDQIDSTPDFGFTRVPKPFRIRAMRRH